MDKTAKKADGTPFELHLAWRFLRSGKRSGRNRFIGFISLVSLAGIALGVASLIVVLSVMNGFQSQVRDRMLAVVAHIEASTSNATGVSTQDALQRIRAVPEVRGAAPFVHEQALLSFQNQLQGVEVRGLLPEDEVQVSPLPAESLAVLRERLPAGEFGVVLGYGLAQRLGVGAGDDVLLLTPKGQISPVGLLPRSKRLHVVALLQSGHQAFDTSVALLHIQDAQRIFRLSGPNGIRIQIADAQRAPEVAAQVQAALDPSWRARDWAQQNPIWFAATRLEKRMMFIVLGLMVAVAGFNLVSGLVMAVRDKRADIAILRTLGASPGAIMRIFMLQGASLGVLGTLLGLLFGLLLVFFIGSIQRVLEALLHFQFFPSSVFSISQIPTQLLGGDLVLVLVFALVLSFLVTLYPSWQAASVQPAAALRYE